MIFSILCKRFLVVLLCMVGFQLLAQTPQVAKGAGATPLGERMPGKRQENHENAIRVLLAPAIERRW